VVPRAWTPIGLLLLGAWLAVGCAQTESRTQVIVAVGSNLAIPDELDRIEVRTAARSAPLESATLAGSYELTPGAKDAQELPLSFGLVPEHNDSNEEFRVIVTGLVAGKPVVEQQALAAFVPGATLLLEIVLSQACLGVLCRDHNQQRTGTACDPASVTCLEVEPSSSLPPWRGPSSELSGVMAESQVEGGLDAAGGAAMPPDGATGGSMDAAESSAVNEGDGSSVQPDMDAGGPKPDSSEAGAQSDAGARSDASSPSDAGSMPESGPSDAMTGALDARAEAGGPSDAATATESSVPDAGDPFARCSAQLRARCAYNAQEVACSSIVSMAIPLSAGGSAGGVEISQGPYGSYVAWNEGSAFSNAVNVGEQACATVGVQNFGEPAAVTSVLADLQGQDLALYTVFRPACMREGETYPVITWANGTCFHAGAAYAPLLATLASYGFVVFAPNSSWTNSAPTDNVQLRALDLAKALNEDRTSVLYGKLDMSQIGAMGHSQGASATVNAGSDTRVKALMFLNTGISSSKPFLDISAERDVASTTPASMTSDVNASPQPGAWVYFHKVLQTGGTSTGHLLPVEQPERLTALTVAWWQYMLKGSATARNMFVGASCGLCNMSSEFEYGAHNLN
jgi:Chlorophyllase enzyme